MVRLWSLNATLDGAGSLFKRSRPGSDSTAAFDQLRDEYYTLATQGATNSAGQFYVKFGPNFYIIVEFFSMVHNLKELYLQVRVS